MPSIFFRVIFMCTPPQVQLPFLYFLTQTIVCFAQFIALFFYSLHAYLIKSPLAMGILGCYNNGKKKDFQSPFHFLISLFVDTPESSGQRFRGSPCPEAGLPIRAKDFYLSLLPFPARYRFIVEDRGSPLWRVATDNSCQGLVLVVSPPGYRSVSLQSVKTVRESR